MTVLQNIKIWMITTGLNAALIAEERKCSEAFISLFLRRKRTSQKLVDYLTGKGCPSNLFKDGKVAKDSERPNGSDIIKENKNNG